VHEIKGAHVPVDLTGSFDAFFTIKREPENGAHTNEFHWVFMAKGKIVDLIDELLGALGLASIKTFFRA